MASEHKHNSQVNENVINQLWTKYFPYWPVFLILIAIAVGSVWYKSRFKLQVYESTATLLIKDEKKGLGESKTEQSINLLSSKKIIENEIEVIKSRALMSQVVKELKLYAPVFEKGKLNDHSAYMTSPVKIEVLNPDSLLEVERVDFVYDAVKEKVGINGLAYSLNQWIATPWGQLRFTLNNRDYHYNSPLYFALIHPKRVIQSLITRIDVSSAGKLSSVVNLKITDEVANRSEDILNTLIAAYNTADVNDKNALATSTLAFLDERLKYVSHDLDSIEQQMQLYKASRGAIDLSSQGKLFLQNVSENDQKLSEVNMKSLILKQVEQYVSSNDTRGGLVPSTLGINDPMLTDLLNKLYDAELEYEKLKRTTGEANPAAVAVADQINKIKPGILENVHSQQSSLEASKNNLRSTNSGYTSLLQGLPRQERDLVEISREQNIKSSIYSFLLQKREETALSHSSVSSDSRIIDRAESALDPVGSGGILLYLVAIFLAIVIGVVLISARELFNRTVLYRHEIEAMTSFPVIGEISSIKTKSPFVLQDGKTSFIAEQFRLLRTSLLYLGIGSRGKKILITSTIPGEGKSFVAANLAFSLAMTGKKVVLVDFDLSNPKQATNFKMEGGNGVADYLAGEIEPAEVIQRTADNPNLFLMPAGNIPDNPSELISQERAKDLLQYLEARFDFVIVDTAPVGLLSDSYILSRYCDATLYVVRHGYTPKKLLERLERNNKINELKNIALVFNGIRARGFAKNDYGYGYGYTYIQKQMKRKQLADTPR